MKPNVARRQLQRELTALLDRGARIQGRLHDPIPPDSEDAAQLMQNDEVLTGLDDRTRASVTEILVALDRIDAGTWTTCSICGETIDDARLEALPTTTTCRRCAGPGVH